MASRFLGVLGFLALAGSCMAGVATYSYSPYSTYHAVHAAPSAALTYASHTPVYHQQPLIYQRTVPAPVALHSAPVALQRTVVAPAPYSAHYVAAPAHTYAAAPTPFVKSVVAPVAPVVTKSIVSAPIAAPLVAKTYAAAPAVPVLRNVIYEGSPRYDFSYGVHDSITGDIKSHLETRDGGNVQGSYSLVDADGYKRTVTYTADDINGFNAVVQREPILTKLATVAVPTQVVAAAPVHHVPVQQQHFQYLPQAPVQAVAVEQQQPQPQQEFVAQEPQLVEQQQPEQVSQQYPQDQQFPPYPQYENPENSQNFPQQPADDAQSNDDSEVIEARTALDKNNEEQKEKSSQESSSTPASPAPVTEDQKENEPASSSSA